MLNSVDAVQINSVYTVFIISIGTHHLHTLIALKFEIVRYITWMCVWDTAVCMAGSVGPGQKLPFATSDLGLHRVERSICGITALFIRCSSVIVFRIIVSILNIHTLLLWPSYNFITCRCV